MFGDEFFPTPKELIRMMIEPYMGRATRHRDGSREINSILEPSAGDGAIVDELRENLGRYSQTKIRAIEMSPELAAIKTGEVVVAIPDPTGIVVDLPERYRERGIELVRNAIQWAREHARIVPRAQATNSEGGAA